MSQTAHPKSILSELSGVAESLGLAPEKTGDSISQINIMTSCFAKWWSLYSNKHQELKLQDRLKVATIGGLLIAAGVACIFLDANGSWGILFLAGSIIWIGFDGLLMAVISQPTLTKSQSSPSRLDLLINSSSLDSCSPCLNGEKASPESLNEILQRMTSATVHAALILWPTQAGWSFKTGSKCSAGLGDKIAVHVSQHKFQPDRQSLFQIRVLDRVLEVLVTPGPLKSGQHFLFVTLHAIDSSFKEHEWLLARHAVLDVSFHLDLILERSPKNGDTIHLFRDRPINSEPLKHQRISRSSDGESITCCSICDEVCVSNAADNQIWKPWAEWLNDVPDLTISHTVCNRCAAGYYQIS